MSEKTNQTTKLHQKYLNPVSTSIVQFVGMSRDFVSAGGIYLQDSQGNQYLDFLSGFGALNLGHEPPEVLEALRSVEGKPNILQNSLNPYTAQLAELLAKVTPGDLSRSFFCNSGSEAVEAALKLARIATGKKKFLSTRNAYHGKTLGALSVSGMEKYQEPFGPLIPGAKIVPYDDLDAIEEELKEKDVAAFIVEPVQGEAGVIVPQKGYLKGAEELCRRYGALLIVDEIQTGMGRTGKLFCCEHEGVKPDILCLSKSLSGGVIPIGAMITTDKLWKKAYGTLPTCLLHSSTFGNNTRASVCALTALQMLIEKNYMTNVEIEGAYLLEELKKFQKKYSVIESVEGKGLMIGIHFQRLKGKSPLLEGSTALWVILRLLRKHHIVTAFTLNNYDILRVSPPLNVSRDQINQFLEALEEALKAPQLIKRLGFIEKAKQLY